MKDKDVWDGSFGSGKMEKINYALPYITPNVPNHSKWNGMDDKQKDSTQKFEEKEMEIQISRQFKNVNPKMLGKNRGLGK